MTSKNVTYTSDFELEIRKEAFAIAMGDKLRKARIEAGYTQAQIAKECYVSRAQVANMESGFSMPTTFALSRFCAALKINIEAIWPEDVSV